MKEILVLSMGLDYVLKSYAFDNCLRTLASLILHSRLIIRYYLLVVSMLSVHTCIKVHYTCPKV